jgi:hypothetical protein
MGCQKALQLTHLVLIGIHCVNAVGPVHVDVKKRASEGSGVARKRAGIGADRCNPSLLVNFDDGVQDFRVAGEEPSGGKSNIHGIGSELRKISLLLKIQIVIQTILTVDGTKAHANLHAFMESIPAVPLAAHKIGGVDIF